MLNGKDPNARAARAGIKYGRLDKDNSLGAVHRLLTQVDRAVS